MAETLTLFKYDTDIHFMLADDINKTVNPPMNNKITKIYKGVDSVLNFYIKDKDRKPVSLTSGSLTAYLVNHITGNLLFSRLVEEINNTTGQAKLKILNKDLVGVESGFYDLSLTFKNVDGETLSLYADRADNVKITIEVKDGSIPNLADSTSLTFSTAGGNENKTYSSAIEVTSVAPDTKGLHTFVVYLTDYIGKLHAEGSIDGTATGWFPITIGTNTKYKDYSTATTSLDPFNFSANLNWVRFAHDPNALNTGTVDKILYRS
jgi:hypothetical protein